MPQQQVHAKRTKTTEPATTEELPAAPATDHMTVEEVDAMLDEIDSVLEENALEFVRAYVQKGGE